MLIDFKLEINISTIIAFVSGIIVGMILLFLIYVLSCLKSIRKKRIIISKEINNIKEEDIKNLIDNAKSQFKIKCKENHTVTFENLRQIVLSLINQVAFRFYPNSKTPLAELTIDELILLDRYMTNKIDDLLSKRGLRLIKKFKISTFLRIINTKNKVENTKVVKSMKEKKIDKVLSTLWSIGHILNPVTWIKKIIVNPTINMLVKKVCLVVISIAGEETYQIYSKKAFLNEDEEKEELLALIEEDTKEKQTN